MRRNPGKLGGRREFESVAAKAEEGKEKNRGQSFRFVIITLAVVLCTSALAPSKAFAGTPGSISTWTTTTSLPQGLESTGTAEYNGYVYVVGGGVNTIEYAKINTDGTLGSWTTTTGSSNLPYDESANSVLAYNGYLYSFGGRSATYQPSVDSGWNDLVYAAPINADGSIGTWTAEPSLPQNLTESNPVIYDGYVYLLGGNNADYLQHTIYTAQINSNGSLGTWNTLSQTLPVYADGAATTVFGGYLYYITGQNCTTVNDGGTCYQNLAYTAPLGANGTIGTFTSQNNVPPQGVYAQASAVQNGYIFTAGGDTSSANTPTDVVYSAPLNPNGVLGTWTTQTPIPENIYAESSVAYNGNLYVIGGTTNGVGSGVVATVYYTTVYGALAPNAPTSPGPASVTNDGYTNNNQPTFTFSQSDPNTPTPNVQYEVKVSTSTNYSNPVTDYTSAFGSTGSASFTVGQNTGSGSYTTGSSGQTLSDGSYYWQVRTINSYLVASGFTAATSSGAAFQLDTIAPVISSVASSTGSTNATVTWNTDELASSQVAYSADTSYASSTAETDTGTRVTSHSVSIPGLLSCDWYNYKVISADAAGNYATSTAYKFFTSGCPGGVTPTAATSTVVTVNAIATTTLADGKETLTAVTPANFTATSSTVVIQIDGLPSTPVLDSIGTPSSSLSSAANIVFNVTALIDNTTVLASFDHAVTITYHYTSADVAGLNPSSLTMYHYHNGAWLQLNDCSVDTAADTITCTAPSFSIFAIFGTPTSSTTSSTSTTASSGGVIPPGYCASNPLPGVSFVVSAECKGQQQKYLGRENTVGSVSTTTTPPSCPAYHFTRWLRYGSQGPDVRALQKFLNCEGFPLAESGPGSPGHETVYFVNRTLHALDAFQFAYATTVLKPVNASSPTGIFALYSQRQAYALMKTK